MDAILVGFFINALWSFGERLIYEIPRLRRDREQVQFIREAFDQIKDEVQSVQGKLDEAALERIGRNFMEHFRGNVAQLNLAASYFRENMPEIMASLERLEAGHEKLERGQQEIMVGLIELRLLYCQRNTDEILCIQCHLQS
jgi:hypothetical protein